MIISICKRLAGLSGTSPEERQRKGTVFSGEQGSEDTTQAKGSVLPPGLECSAEVHRPVVDTFSSFTAPPGHSKSGYYPWIMPNYSRAKYVGLWSWGERT